MGSKYDDTDLLGVHGLTALDKRLKPTIAKTIYHLIQIFWDNMGKEKGTPQSYSLFLRQNLKNLLLDFYNDVAVLYNIEKENPQRADAVMLIWIDQLYEHSKPYLRDQGIDNI